MLYNNWGGGNRSLLSYVCVCVKRSRSGSRSFQRDRSRDNWHQPFEFIDFFVIFCFVNCDF